MPHFREKVKTKTEKAIPRTTKLVRKYKHKRSESNDSEYEDKLDKEEKFEELKVHAILSRCEELTADLLYDEDRLDRGDFIIARIVWNEDKHKFHDHSAIIENRNANGINVLFISDLCDEGDESKSVNWSFEELARLINDEKLHFLRFNLLDVQDEDDIVVARAKAYKVPENDELSMQFGFICTFGTKQPIFDDYQLTFCANNSLLLLRGEQGVKFVHLRQNENDNFLVSFADTSDKVKAMSFDDILNMGGSARAALYLLRGVQIKSLADLPEIETLVQGSKELTTEIAWGAAQATVIDVLPSFAELGLGGIDGLGLGAAVSTALATKDTVKARRKERLFEKTGGLSGSSRTNANKKITKTWTGAVAGTTTGFLGGATTGALIGQAAIPIPVLGAVVGGVVGGAVSGFVGSKLSGKASEKIFDRTIRHKCPLC